MQQGYVRPALDLDGRLAAIAGSDYPRFSPAEIERRRSAMAREMEALGVDHLVVSASGFRGGPVHWLSDWLTTHEAVQVYSPGRPDAIFIHFYNHLPQARRLMPDVDIKWAGPSTIESVFAELRRRGARSGKVGALGMM